MPSFQIHLAIAKRYMEKHTIQDRDAFIEGNLAPDFVKPKEKSHYTIETKNKDLLEEMNNKVDFDRFLRENKIKTDYDRGVLLHLLSDRIFYTEFFDRDFLQKANYDEFVGDLYRSYNKTNEYLRERYPITIKKELSDRIEQNIEESNKRANVDLREEKQIISIEKLDAFIERMSNANLEEYVTRE